MSKRLYQDEDQEEHAEPEEEGEIWGDHKTNTKSMWVVVKIRVPFWVPYIVGAVL